jgi:hypothetical protein
MVRPRDRRVEAAAGQDVTQQDQCRPARTAVTSQMPAQAQAEGTISESFARTLCQWSDKLPEDCRDAADTILAGTARSGTDLRDLAEIAGEMDARSRPDTPDSDPAGEFDDRSLRLDTTFGTSPAATYKQPGTYFHALLTGMQPSSHRSPAR